ncbi:MAG: ParB N-terminal domain-containing protein, partial [Bacilli bacterium]|nr:ParB N-terminal domain-containing protein [Bacilli bacterium]
RDNNNLLKNEEKSLFSRKKTDNIKEVSPDLVEEIQKKTISNIKNKENVKMVSIDELLKYKKNGGYRTSEDIIRLTNNIMANGIETPIEISKNNTNIEIYNGNHRLMIAEKLGLKEVPVKYIDTDIENNINSSYNNDINSYIEGEENGNITRTAKFEKIDDKSKNNTKYSLTDSKQSNIEQRISRYGRLSDSLSGYNDGSSSNTAFGENDTSKNTEQGLNNSSFSFDENAKQYTNLNETEKIEFYTKENGDIKISLLDSNTNIVNDFSAISERELKKQLGDEIGEYISNKSNNNVNSINLQHENNNTSVDEDYKMNHRPSVDYGNASDFEHNMADIFEHPEWYLDMTESYNRESLNALKGVRNNPEGYLKIYRATPDNKINPGDWVTPSKKYAQEHLERSLNGNGNIVEITVKAKDVLFAGDDINEFGYFPENTKYSKSNGTWQEFVESNFKTKGSRTNLSAIRKYSTNTEQKLINKKSDKIKEQLEKEKNKRKNYITKEVSKILEFSDYKTKQKFTNLISEYYDNPNKEQIKQDVLENFSEKRIEYINDELANIKRQIRTTDLKVNDYVKRNMIDYNFFRKENFSKLKLKKEGQSIDSFYTEMSEIYPNIFSKDITNEVDQLQRLSEFMNEDISIVEKYNLDDEVINKATDYIYNSLKNKENIDDLISSISISPKEIRKEKTVELREFASEFLENSSDWKDKKSGLAYKINTMKRNFYDIMEKKDAKRLYENFIETIFNHSSQMQKDISKYNDKISKLKLKKNESIAVQMFGELKYNPETLVTQMQVDEFIEKNKLNYDKIAKSVEVFRNVYDELLKRRNATLKEMGYKEVDYRKGYFPHFVENKPTSIFGKALEKIGWKFNDDSIPTSIAGITEQFKPGKIWTSSSQQRKGKYTDYNALKGFDNYIRGAMNEIYFTEDIQKLRALENEIRYQHSDKGIQNRIDEIHSDNSLTFEEKQDKIDKVYTTYITPLNNFVSELRDYTNGLANKKSGLDRTVESLANRKFYNTMSNISSRLSANMVGLNLGSAITNFIPITQAASQVKSKYLLKGLKEAIKSQYSADGFESKSVFLTTRLNETERLYKTKLEKISEKANFIFDGIDSITANTIVRGKYYENIAKGMTEFNAMRNADEFARDLMAGRGKGEMPTAFNSKNPIVKAFTAFQLETANQFGYMLKDLPRDLEDETKNKLVSAFVKMFFGAWIYNQLTEKVVGRKAAFSPADTIKEIYDTATDGDSKIKDKSSDILEKLTGDIPFVGGLVGGGRLPISSVANPIKILKGESTIKDETKKALYYTVMPSGGGQLKKTVEGTLLYKKSLNPFSKDFMKKREMPGSYNQKGELRFEAKKNPLSVTQNLLFGQYSSKNARNYFEHNYMPVSKETTKRLKKDNISISKYRDYEDKYNSLKNSKGDKLKEIKSDKDSEGKPISGSASAKKAYLIMKSDFSDKEKNYMLSKLSNFKNEDDVSMLKKLGDDQKNYNLYYSLSKEKKKEFISEIDNYRISVSQLTEFYNMRKNANKEYTSAKSKEVIMNYLSNSNLEDKTKWYLYSKDYGSDKLSKQIETFKIKSDDYFNIIKIKNDITQKYPGNKNSKKRKE